MLATNEVCSALDSVTIGNSVTNIGTYAFYYCKLKKVVCKAITPPMIDYYTFRLNQRQTTLKIPKSVISDYNNTYWKYLGITEQYDLELTDDDPFLVSEVYDEDYISYTRDVSTSQYASLSLPYDVKVSDMEGADKIYKPMNVAFYNPNTYRLQMFFEQVDPSTTLPAGTPVIVKTNGNTLYASNATETTIPEVMPNPEAMTLKVYNQDDASSLLYENNDIQLKWCGTYTSKEAVNGMKSFNADGSFGQHTGTLSPFRAYIMQTTSNGAKITGVDLNFGDDVTAIEHITLSNVQNNDSRIYNMQGQEVKTMQHGQIYIINGRKVIKK